MLNLNQLKDLYINSPLWLKRLYASIPYAIRNGSEYRKWNSFLSQSLNEEEYLVLKMKESLYYAYDNTLYYKRVYSELGILPQDINDISDYEKLPFINKDIVKNNFNEFTAQNYAKGKTFFVTTGGTSGEPMKFLQSNNIWSKELAFTINYFSKYGYNPSCLKASFRGGEFTNLPKNKYWKYNPVHNEIHFSPFHINSTTIEYYVRDLNQIKPKFFHTYPSSLLLLIEQMINKNLSLTYKIEAIFLISENFSKKDIEKIKFFFNCKISAFYGHSERLIFAPNYNESLTSYKIDNRYGYFELIDNHGRKIGKNNITGEIVGTSFDNYAMPLIRYKTNDFTSYIESEHNIISAVEGRWSQEYLLGKNGFKLYLTALNMHSDIFKNVIRYQYYQNRPEIVELNIITNNLFKEKDKINILQALNEKAGHAISFQINIVDQLRLTPRGKLKNIIKEIK